MNQEQKLLRTLIGEVISNKMEKTIVVLVTRQVKHPRYGKYIRRSTKIHAHDEQKICQKGDIVMIKEGRPLAKTKSWSLEKVLEKKFF